MVGLLTGSACPGEEALLWMLPRNGPQDRPSARLCRACTHFCPSCRTCSSSSVGRDISGMRNTCCGDCPTLLPAQVQPTPVALAPRSSRGAAGQRRKGCPVTEMIAGAWFLGARTAPVARPLLETMGCRDRTMRGNCSWIRACRCTAWEPWLLCQGHAWSGDPCCSVRDTRDPRTGQSGTDKVACAQDACMKPGHPCCLCWGGIEWRMMMLTRPTPITARSSQPLPIGWVPDSAEQAGEGSRGRVGLWFPHL